MKLFHLFKPSLFKNKLTTHSKTGVLDRTSKMIWNRLPASWLGDLTDARVRADVVKAIFQNQGFSIIVHFSISIAYYFSYEIIRNHIWMQFLLVIFCVISLARYGVQKLAFREAQSDEDSIKYLLFGMISSACLAAILSTIALVFLKTEDKGFNSPAVFAALLYYFAAIIKNISVRLITIIYSMVILAPLAIYFLVQGSSSETVIGIFILILLASMLKFAKTMEGIITSRIKQSYTLESLAQQLTQERDRADAANQSKSQFLAAASHDLRQPVHAIGLYLCTLTETDKPTGDQHAISGIRQSWSALDDLLSHILELSLAENNALHPAPENIELAPVLRGLVLHYSVSATKKNQRIVILGRPHAYVWADLPMLHRVLSNLLDNAIKYAPPNSTVALVVRSRGTNWAIQVRDAGPGIAPEDSEKIFDIFFQAHNRERSRHAGYGIGLSIAQRFATAMGGSIALRSAVGRGTCMTVLLPKAITPALSYSNAGGRSGFVSNDAATPPIPLRLSAFTIARIGRSGKKILLVEDDPLVSDAFAQVFSMLKLPHHCVSRAEPAMLLTDQTLLAICDVRLPGEKSGLDVAQHFTALGIPVLLLTGESLQLLKPELERLKLDCLQKPVKPQQILAWIEATV